MYEHIILIYVWQNIQYGLELMPSFHLLFMNEADHWISKISYCLLPTISFHIPQRLARQTGRDTGQQHTTQGSMSFCNTNVEVCKQTKNARCILDAVKVSICYYYYREPCRTFKKWRYIHSFLEAEIRKKNAIKCCAQICNNKIPITYVV